MKKLLLFFFVFTACCLFSKNTADLLYLGAGYNNVVRPNNRHTEFRAEYKSRKAWWLFRPIAGLSVTDKKQVYASLGVSLDLYLTQYFVFAPTFEAGYYYKGSGKDLGFPLEFRSGVELSVRFKNLLRIGTHFSHTSNASLGKKNPGLETLLFFIAIPLKYSNK